MRILNKDEYKLFQSIAMLSQKNLYNTLIKVLSKKYNQIIKTDDYIIAIGDIPIALVAHLDTVFSTPPTQIYYDKEKGVIWSPQGGCGDDRCGVYIILKILQSNLRPTIIFTTDEEKGCIGSLKLVSDLPVAPTELNYIIQLDRRGEVDCVFYDCDNKQFVDYVEKFGFVEAWGSFTDISEICPTWGIAGVNLSVGYFNEHSKSETVHTGHMLNTLDKVITMLSEQEIPKFIYIPSPHAYNFNYFKSLDLNSDFPREDDFYDEYENMEVVCTKCFKPFKMSEVFPVENNDTDNTEFYCIDCITVVNNINWCIECGEAFISKNKNTTNCRYCGGNKKCTNNYKKISVK